jgi:hypothetical protein
MAKQKAINWPAIKKRYLLDEKPKKIALDYENLTAKQISAKAERESWKGKKEEIKGKVELDVLDELDEIHSIYSGLILDTGKKLKQARAEGLIGLTIQDGEGFASKFADNDQKAGLALILEHRKHANKLQLAKMEQEAKKPDVPETSRPVYRSIYKGGDFNSTSTGNFASKAILPVESGDSRSPEWEDDSSD